MRKRILVAIFSVLMSVNLPAQEFLCDISVQLQGIQGVDPSIFDAMQKSMFEFMNNKKWSGYNFKMEERIQCTMLFTITGVKGSDEFSGTLNIVLQRPVYKSDYASPVINMIDKDIHFKYIPYQSMEFVENTYTDNLTSILAYYSYLMLGLDFDTFSLYGGDPFYEKAQSVVNSAQNSNEKGWQAFEGPKNRNQFLAGITNSSYNNLRMFLYEYHRRGLDIMSDDVEAGRSVCGKSLRHFKAVNDKRPGLYPLQVFVETKRSELINIFKKATPAEKTAMINIMKDVDPANSSTYDAVNKGR